MVEFQSKGPFTIPAFGQFPKENSLWSSGTICKWNGNTHYIIFLAVSPYIGLDLIISQTQSGQDIIPLHICHHHSRVASGKSISASLFQRNSCKGQFSLISRYLQLLNSVFTDLTKVFFCTTQPHSCAQSLILSKNLIRHSWTAK